MGEGGYPRKRWGSSPAVGLETRGRFLGSYFLSSNPPVHGPQHFTNPNPSSHTATAAPHSSPPISPSWGCPQLLSSLMQVWPSLLSPRCRESFSHRKSQLLGALLIDFRGFVSYVQPCPTVCGEAHRHLGGWMHRVPVILLLRHFWKTHQQGLGFTWPTEVPGGLPGMSVVSAVRVPRSSASLRLHPACA